MPLSFQMCVVPPRGCPGRWGTEGGPGSLYLHFERRAQRFSCLQRNAHIWAPSGPLLLLAAAVANPGLPTLGASLDPQDADLPCSQFQSFPLPTSGIMLQQIAMLLVFKFVVYVNCFCRRVHFSCE